MKLKFLLALFSLLPTALYAQWKNVGNAEYNWGPFHVYTINLATETGDYKFGQFPLMLSFKYEKPVEGKAFAISLVKELEGLNSDKAQTDHWVRVLQSIFPDFSPNDVLTYIALPERGYFVYKDVILDHEFGRDFNQAFVNIWLSEKSSFQKLQPELFGKQPAKHQEQEFKPNLKPQIVTEDDAVPQIPPTFELFERHKDVG